MSPRTPKQFKEIREEKRALIMDVALERFANNGFHATTINHIAKQAGISKGLMYNYFKSKEELLMEIINRSVIEIAQVFDSGKDGRLSEKEFELFIRRLFHLLREKLPFCRLFYQLIIQKDVRDHFLNTHLGEGNTIPKLYSNTGSSFLASTSKMITEYFISKKEKKPADFDPILEQYMFIYTIEGFIMLTSYLDVIDDDYYERTVNRIIEIYK